MGTYIRVEKQDLMGTDKMKNIMVIDEAPNCAYDIFAVSNEIFKLIFPNDGQNIEFYEQFISRLENENKEIFKELWKRPVIKSDVCGIHGILFSGLMSEKKRFYPNKKDSDLDGWARGWVSDPNAPPVNTPEFMEKLWSNEDDS